MIVTNHALLRYAERHPISTHGMSLEDMRQEIIQLAITTSPHWIVIEDNRIVTILEPGMRPMKTKRARKRRSAKKRPSE